MTYVALSRKWRPQRFDEVVGQQHVVRTLRNALRTDRVHHAYLFSGPRGVGKTTMARLFAKSLNCTQRGDDGEPCNRCPSCVEITSGRSLDVVEIDAASNNGVDDIRELRENVKLGTVSSRYRVYIVDEAHMLSTAAWNAFLKTLEEPPSHVIFIFASTEKSKFPPTILSRCQQFEFRRMTHDEIVARLRELATDEAFEIGDDSLALIAQQSEGCLRDAQSLLEQLIAYTDGKATEEDVSRMLGYGSAHAMEELTAALLERDAPRAIAMTHELVDQGADVSQCLRLLTTHFHGLLRLNVSEALANTIQASPSKIEQMKAQAKQVSLARLEWTIKLLMQAERNIKLLGYDAYNFELAMLDICRLEEAIPLEAVLEKLEEVEARLETAPTVPASMPTSPSPSGRDATDTEPAVTETPPSEPPIELTPDAAEVLWKGIQEWLAEHGERLMCSHLQNAKVTVEGGQLVVAFPRRTMLNNVRGKRAKLDQAIAAVAGRPVPILLQLREEETVARAEISTERAPEDERKEREQMVLDVFTGTID